MTVELSDGFSAEPDLNGSTEALNIRCFQVDSPFDCATRLNVQRGANRGGGFIAASELSAGLDGNATLKKLTKPLRRKAGVTHDAAESEGVDRVITWDGKNARAVGHNDVLGLANDVEARLLESTNCREMINAGNLGQDLDHDFYLTHFFTAKLLIDNRKIFTEGIFDIFDGLNLG